MSPEEKQDHDLIFVQGERPLYMVTSSKVGRAFIDPVLAIQWHNKMRINGILTSIIDLRDYDWDKNPANIAYHYNINTDDALRSLANHINGKTN